VGADRACLQGKWERSRRVTIRDRGRTCIVGSGLAIGGKARRDEAPAAAARAAATARGGRLSHPEGGIGKLFRSGVSVFKPAYQGRCTRLICQVEMAIDGKMERA
jgi:hypothetical protein